MSFFLLEKSCRERWRNIRTSYVRSLKQTRSGPGVKSKKPYYLAAHLAFLQPYLKGGETSSILGLKNITGEEFNTEEAPECPITDKTEECSAELNEKTVCKNEPKRKRNPNDEVEEAFLGRMKQKNTAKKNEDSEHHFLLSLRDDMKRLTPRRLREFKLRTMTLLYRFLDEDGNDRTSSIIESSRSPTIWIPRPKSETPSPTPWTPQPKPQTP